MLERFCLGVVLRVTPSVEKVVLESSIQIRYLHVAWLLFHCVQSYAIVRNTTSNAKKPSLPFSTLSKPPKLRMREYITLASSLVGVGWCDRISSFCSWWHGEGDGPVCEMLVVTSAFGYLRSYVALSADHLIAIELGGEGLERRLNDTTAETEDKVES